ncbi:MAG: Holliday junction branch migration DNA helicase RuvB, partial [bacterium]
MREDSILNPAPVEEDLHLRPRALADFVGQEAVKERLRIAIEAARTQGRPLDHVLLSG